MCRAMVCKLYCYGMPRMLAPPPTPAAAVKPPHEKLRTPVHVIGWQVQRAAACNQRADCGQPQRHTDLQAGMQMLHSCAMEFWVAPEPGKVLVADAGSLVDLNHSAAGGIGNLNPRLGARDRQDYLMNHLAPIKHVMHCICVSL
jgi:hypothetical protein